MAVGGRPCSGHEVEVGDWAPLSALDLHAKFADMGLKALDLEVQLGADSLRRGAFVRQGLNEDGSVQVLRRSVRERRGDLEDRKNACAGTRQCVCAICAVCSWHVHAWVLVQMTEPGCWPDVAAMPVVGSLPLFDAHLDTPRIGSQGRVGRRRGLRGTHSWFAEGVAVLPVLIRRAGPGSVRRPWAGAVISASLRAEVDTQPHTWLHAIWGWAVCLLLAAAPVGFLALSFHSTHAVRILVWAGATSIPSSYCLSCAQSVAALAPTFPGDIARSKPALSVPSTARSRMLTGSGPLTQWLAPFSIYDWFRSRYYSTCCSPLENAHNRVYF